MRRDFLYSLPGLVTPIVQASFDTFCASILIGRDGSVPMLVPEPWA